MSNRRKARFDFSMATGPRADETCNETYPILWLGICRADLAGRVR